MTKAIETFRIRQIQGRMHASLYCDLKLNDPLHPTYQSRVDRFREELEAWRSSLPIEVQENGEPLTLFTGSYWWDMYYHNLILNLYRGLLTSPAPCKTEIVFECLESAADMCRGLRAQLLGKRTTPTWGALHSCFIAGLTYLHCLWFSPAIRDATRQDVVSSTCQDCTIALVLMAQWHEAASPYRDIFECLAARTITMLVDKKQEKVSGSVNTTAAENGNPDSEQCSQWMGDIASGNGMSDDVERLLYGLIWELPPDNTPSW